MAGQQDETRPARGRSCCRQHRPVTAPSTGLLPALPLLPCRSGTDWISFHNGYFEAKGTATDNATNKMAYRTNFKRGLGSPGAKILTQFLRNENCGFMGRTTNYSPGGFLVKKGTVPGSQVSASGSGMINYPWPIVRLAELYLNYAEACVESGDINEAKIYIDKLCSARPPVLRYISAWDIALESVTFYNKRRDCLCRRCDSSFEIDYST